MGRIVSNRILGDGTTYANVTDAIKNTGLDWNVEKHPLFARIPNPADKDHGIFKRADNLFAVTRSDRNTTLGAVTAQYQTISNAQGFAGLDALQDEGGLRIITAGELDGGAQVFMQAQSSAPLTIGGEPIASSIIAIMRHDGGGSLRYLPSFVRFFCTNQLRGLVAAARGFDFAMPIRHSSNAGQRIHDARIAMNRLREAQKAFVDTAEALLARTFTAHEMRALADTLLPRPDDSLPTTTTREVANWEARMDMLMREAYFARDLDDVRYTAWGAYNAVADYEQHLVRVTGDATQREDRLFRRMIEPGTLTARAGHLLLG